MALGDADGSDTPEALAALLEMRAKRRAQREAAWKRAADLLTVARDGVRELRETLSAHGQAKRGSAPRASVAGGKIPTESRKSLFTSMEVSELGGGIRKLGGIHISITPSQDTGALDCLLIEPMGKKLDPENYESSGLVICFDGMPPSPALLDEWAETMQRAGWIELGLTVVLPNLQMNSAMEMQDLIGMTDALLEKLKFSECLMCGKAWGGQRMVELASHESMHEKIVGLILCAPSTPCPEHGCKELPVPVLLAWAHDDDISSVDEAQEYVLAFDGRPAPTTLELVDTGGHSLSAMLADDHLAQAFRQFTAAAVLHHEMQKAPDTVGQMSSRRSRMSVELPGNLQRALESGASGHDHLAAWIEEGMVGDE